MPTIETGFFGILVGLAFVFTFIAGRGNRGLPTTFLQVVALGMFLVLSVMMAAGYEVSATTTGETELHYNSTGNLVLNVTKSDTKQVFIPGGEDSYWLTYIFLGMAGLNLIMFVKGAYYGS